MSLLAQVSRQVFHLHCCAQGLLEFGALGHFCACVGPHLNIDVEICFNVRTYTRTTSVAAGVGTAACKGDLIEQDGLCEVNPLV
jgi:hypothetical protein